jgi:hypothetical protein
MSTCPGRCHASLHADDSTVQYHLVDVHCGLLFHPSTRPLQRSHLDQLSMSDALQRSVLGWWTATWHVHKLGPWAGLACSGVLLIGGKTLAGQTLTDCSDSPPQPSGRVRRKQQFEVASCTSWRLQRHARRSDDTTSRLRGARDRVTC